MSTCQIFQRVAAAGQEYLKYGPESGPTKARMQVLGGWVLQPRLHRFCLEFQEGAVTDTALLISSMA